MPRQQNNQKEIKEEEKRENSQVINKVNEELMSIPGLTYVMGNSSLGLKGIEFALGIYAVLNWKKQMFCVELKDRNRSL